MALAALTRSEAGSLILRGAETVEVAAEPAAWSTPPAPATPMPPGSWPADRRTDLAACGRLGSIAAAEVIGHFGARPLRDLRGELAALGD